MTLKHGTLSTISFLYDDQAGLEAFIQKNCITNNAQTSQWLVCIHTCCHTQLGSVAIAKHVSKLLPNAKIIGTSASAVIARSTVYEDSCLLLFTRFDHTDITVHRLSYESLTPRQLAECTCREVIRSSTKAILSFFSDQYLQAQEYLDHLHNQGMDVPMGGGLVSPNLYGTYTFDENGAYQNMLMLAAMHSDVLRCYHGVINGHEAFSDAYTITAAKGSDILEVENTPAVAWFCDKLGVSSTGDSDTPALCSDLLLRFPLMRTDESHASRLVRYCEPRDQMEAYSTVIEPGMKFRLGYLSPLTAAAELKQICRTLETTPCQTIFTYPCIFRRNYLSNCTEWELRMFRSGRICGTFMYGEINMAEQRNALYIGSHSLFGLSESDSDYLPIDRTLLENLQCLDEDWQDIHQYILRIQNEQLSEKDLAVSAMILRKEENLRHSMFVDKETRLENLVKYKYDDMKNQYDKICMISIEKGILISGRRGTKVWNRLMQENIQQVKNTLHDDALHLYCNDTWSFFFTAGKDYPDELFLQKAEEVFRECGYCFCSEYDITAVNNFHVVIGETNLLEKVQLCMSSQTDHNARFFIYNKDNAEMIKQMDEKLFMTNVISDAILYDRIVPYFQPIRDNRTKEITKYEALMRLSDKDRNIYAPGQFLEIAKDYHLYLQLSQLMIRKVLELFRDRKECVFLNLSAYDIGSKSNRSFLYDLLSELPPEACERITFEILESEKVRDFQEMVEFLNDIRKFGVKIAIDDFGAGFSNFTAIIRVNPDFIKIDGDLIINCDKDPVKKICLQAITDIARGIDAELIAEHVENSDEQETVESVNIEYTQGYYFSKPVPYDVLDKKTDEA